MYIYTLYIYIYVHINLLFTTGWHRPTTTWLIGPDGEISPFRCHSSHGSSCRTSPRSKQRIIWGPNVVGWPTPWPRPTVKVFGVFGKTHGFSDCPMIFHGALLVIPVKYRRWFRTWIMLDVMFISGSLFWCYLKWVGVISLRKCEMLGPDPSFKL